MAVLIVRGTKKLRDRVKGAPAPGEGETSTSPLDDWFATALFWKPQVVLLVNTRTFLPVFMPLAPAATLLDRIPAAIAEVLTHHGVPTDHVDAELIAMSDVTLAPTNDRQVLGVVNEFAFQADHRRAVVSGGLLGLSLDLSRLPLSPLRSRGGRPIDELEAMFAPDAKILAFPPASQASSTDAASADRPGRSVHQLKVTLKDIRPPVWRRVVVDGSETLHHLHTVIQAAFGWFNSHLHAFVIDGIDYGIPHQDDWTPVQDERRLTLDAALRTKRFTYTYDFGDNWVHDIVLEQTYEVGSDDAPAAVPDCIDGRRACPPEDCGGPWGYPELLEILADPNHAEHSERLEWLGGPFDPEAFDASTFADDLAFGQIVEYNDFS